MSCHDRNNVFRDDFSYYSSKRIKLDNEESKTELGLNHEVVSNNLNKEDEGDNVSVISNCSCSEPEELESNSNGIRNSYVLGALLNTFFPLQKAQQSDLRIKTSRVSDYMGTSLKIHPYLPADVKDTTIDSAKYIVDTMYSIAQFLNVSDISRMESNFRNILSENCVLITPALLKPRVGFNHVIELFASMHRSSMDFKFAPYDHTIEKVNGTTVITFHHNVECKLNIIKFSIFN